MDIAQFFAILWIALEITPALFWFFLVKEFNKKAKTKFPSFIYSIFYLIPGVHYYISWSFIKDIRQFQIESKSSDIIPLFKTYFLKLVLPHFLLVAGLYIVAILGVVLVIFAGSLGELIIGLSSVIPYVSFIWLAWGFYSLMKTIKSI